MRKNNQSGEKRMTATRMRLILSILLVLIIAGISAGFYFSYLYLEKISQEVASTQAEANSSDAELQNLIKTQQQLKQNRVAVERAKQLVAESQSYRYQDQVIKDLSEYASRSKVSISSFSFSAPDDSSTDTIDEPQGPGVDRPGALEGAAADATGGNRTTTVSIKLGEQTNYASLLHFVHLIEENLTKMQISQFSIAKGDSPENVSSQILDIEVYIR